MLEAPNYSIRYHKVYSAVLGKEMAFSVCEPDRPEGQSISTLFFLHGRTGNETLIEQLGMDKALSQLAEQGRRIRIVCPCLDNSRGINSSVTYQVVKGKYADVHKGRYEDYLINELIPFVDQHYPTDQRMIGGISSGGYTALSLAMRHPQLFSKVGAHMPAIDLDYADEDECYFADREMWCAYDPLELAERDGIGALKFYLDDGLQDEGGFYRACQKLHDALTAKGISSELHVRDGHHCAAYIVEHLMEYLCFYMDLGLEADE